MKSAMTLFTTMLLILSCGKENPATKATLFTSILPQKYFVERITGGSIAADVLVKPGKSPATYEPTPDQMISLSKSKILFTLGVPFEKTFLKTVKSSLKNLEIVDTSVGIKRRFLENHDHHDEDGDHEEHDHSHGKTEDPHTWLSPRLAQIHSENIYKALLKAFPEKKKELTKNYKSLISDLKNLDKELGRYLNPMKGRIIFVFHPAFGYLTDEYGMKQMAIESGGKSPLPSDLAEIIKKAKHEKVRVIFVQPEFPEKSARAVAKAINGAVIRINPLNPDYINNLKEMARQIKESTK